MSAAVQSTRALALQQLAAVNTYVKRVTDDKDRSGLAIQRVVEDGFYAEVEVSADTETFVLAFTDRAAQQLENRYDQLVIELDLDSIQTHEH